MWSADARKFIISKEDSEIKGYALYLGNISEDFTINNIKWIFFVDFNTVETNDILGIHKYLMKGTWCKLMFQLIKKITDN